MTIIEEKAALLDWINDQDRLRIERWHRIGGRSEVQVWTICDDEDEPSGRGETVIEALLVAKRASEE